MKPEIGGRLVLVIASIDASRTISASVRGFLDEVGDRGEVIVADASRDGSAGFAREISSSIRVLDRPPGSLAPELWRDGLDASTSDYVAFTTAQMVPRRGWLDAMMRTLRDSGAAGVGGPIAPASGLSRTDQALYLLRYANYLPPVLASGAFDPPGDNAMYRRDRLAGLEPAWERGFWEVELHRLLRSRGEALASTPDAVVEFRGGASLGSSLKHRLLHARHFGAGRGEGQSFPRRLARSAVSPAVPAVLMARIARGLRRRGEPLAPWLGSIPQLALMVSAWSLGEAAGGLLGPASRSGKAA